MSIPDRKAKLDKSHVDLSVRSQCKLLRLVRSGVYRQTTAITHHDDLEVMRRIDELYTRWPFMGSRRLVLMLGKAGLTVNRKRVQRLMPQMGLEALGPKPNTSKAAKGHKIYPYLLRDLQITRPNHVWCTDITYIPIGSGYLYLVAIMDWASRVVLSWRLSNSMATSFCIEALEEALATHGKPEIFNSDQGSQFTSEALTAVLTKAGIKVSMDGRGRWMDNVFIERLWRSLKWEDIYLKHYGDGSEVRLGIAAWIDFYNTIRPHTALANQTPMGFWKEAIWKEAALADAVTAQRSMDTMDNERALPTYLQPKQQLKKAA